MNSNVRADAGAERPAPEPIAIIGMACMFPQAPDLPTFWRNIIQGVDAVGEPAPAWDAQRYLDSGRIKTASGGYLKDLFRFDPREFGIMPNSIDGGEPDQFLALRVARDALADAGYLQGHDHVDTGIVLGHSTYLHRGQGAILQNTLVLDQTMELLRAAFPTLESDRLAEVEALLRSKLPPCNADIAPGLVPNVMTGRIANRLNLKGPNYLVDAACSSSLLAVNAAVDELRSGRSRLMLAGGVNASLPAEVTVIFTQLGALSGRGKVRPFEVGSDGTLLGEGLGVVVLKRVTDALADGDRIYAVLRGIGQASDGRGQGLLAPSVEGETLAIRRAYDGSGVDPASISLIEAHGTGIPLGDRTEIAALKNVFGARRTPQAAMAIGSVKSMISHCIPAAGIAGLIKTALALHHRTLPPSLCGTVNPELGIADTPFHVNTRPTPWIGRTDGVRRAGVNSFGFGGINVHAIVEEPPVDAGRHPDSTPWPAELCVFAAESRDALVAKLEAVAGRLADRPDARLADVAAGLATAESSGSFRLALVARDTPALAKSITTALARLREDPAERWATRGGSVFCSRPLEGRLAFVFPGEGSQYTGMLGDLALCFGEVRHWLDFWHTLYDEPRGANRTDVVFPPASELDDARRLELESRLHGMDVGSEAVFVAGQALHSLLHSLGVEPDVMLGHSSGESAALAASRAVPGASAELAAFIRQLNGVYERVLGEGRIATGALLAVGALASSAVEALIAATAPDVVVAMDNCANQLVLYGSREAIASLQIALTDAGAICMPLPFDRGYHTAAFADVSAAFSSFYQSIALAAPAVPLYSCATAARFPTDEKAVRELAAAQWSKKVRFRETIERMHADGVRYFVEVGPSGNLTAFVNDILAGKERCALATNLRRRNGVEQLLSVLAELHASGKPVNVGQLFVGRGLAALGLDAPAPRSPGPALDNTMPMLRLDAADRELVQRAVSGAASAQVGRRDERSDPVAAAAVASAPTDARSADIEETRDAEAQAAASLRAGVMAGYFDLMRDFLEQQRAIVEAREPHSAAARSDPAEDLGGLPFVDEVVERTESRVVVRCRLSLDDEFLRSHVLSGPVSHADAGLLGLACVPLMVSLEIMAEACSLVAGSRRLGVIENVRALDWIALDDGLVELEVHAEVVDASRRLCRARIFNGAVMAATADYAFDFEPQIDGLAALTGTRSSRWDGSELYSTGMFHGPVFQSVRRIAGWNAEGIDAALSDVSLDGFFGPGNAPSLILNPVLLDAVGQVAAYWIAQQAGTDFNCFPSTIRRIELLASCPAGIEGLVLRGRQQPLERHRDEIAAPRSWQFDCVDSTGAPLLRVDGLVNVFFEVPHAFYQVRRDPLHGLLGRAGVAPRVPGAVLWEVAQFSEEFCAQSSSIFLRILAHALLGHSEREEWRALTGSVRRRREWLLGRAAIKEAVRIVLHERTGVLLYPSDIVVRHDALGAPHVDGGWRDALGAPPHVSLSHTARACLVAVSDSDSAVGVDFEDLGRVAQPDLLLGALTAGERAAVAGLSGGALDERLLRLWCAKEAAAKYLGVGLQGRPEGFGVHFVDTGCERAVVDFEGVTIDVGIVRDGPAVIAVAQSPAGVGVS